MSGAAHNREFDDLRTLTGGAFLYAFRRVVERGEEVMPSKSERDSDAIVSDVNESALALKCAGLLQYDCGRCHSANRHNATLPNPRFRASGIGNEKVTQIKSLSCVIDGLNESDRSSVSDGRLITRGNPLPRRGGGSTHSAPNNTLAAPSASAGEALSPKQTVSPIPHEERPE